MSNRYVSRLAKDTLAIFLLHGVIEKSPYRIRNYTRKHLEKDYFFSIIKELKVAGNPLSMDDVVEHHIDREPYPPNSFAITFDDGFENNYSVAAPLLKDLAIPATFYVSTDFIENKTMSWIDRIENCVEQTSLPFLKLPWDMNETPIASPEQAKALLDDVRSRVKQDPTINVMDLIERIYQQCSMGPVISSDDPLDRKMTWQQLSQLDSDDNFIVGGHSHYHSILSFLDEDQLELEVSLSLSLLQGKSGIATQHYSYPEGLQHCYSESVITCLKQKGILCSPTAIDGVCRYTDDLFHLKRIFII